MSKYPPNSIVIGQGKWIEHVDVADKVSNAVDIDLKLQDIDQFWSLLETQCEAGYCGIDAFDFEAETIVKAANSLDFEYVSSSLLTLRCYIQSLESEVLSSNRLNNYFDKKVFLQLVDHLVSSLRT